MDQVAIESVAQRILESGDKPNVASTGAGISVESGIPDFRSAGGLWTRFDPMEYATIEAFRADPEKVWTMLVEMRKVIEQASPNPAHVALARLEELGLLGGVITQNIDNLHQAAGSRTVIEFHGNAGRLVCSCGYAEDAPTAGQKMDAGRSMPPECESCGAILKPDVVLFGEPIPEGPGQQAMELAARAGVFLLVGTSATVAPASYLPVVAKKAGATLVEVNPEPTPLTDVADFSLRGKAGDVLPALTQKVEQLLPTA